MEWLFSWEVSSWIVGLGIALGCGFVASSDFKLARLFFLIAAADATGGIAMWGAKGQLSLWQSYTAVFLMAGVVGVLTFSAFRYTDKKRDVTPEVVNAVPVYPAVDFDLAAEKVDYNIGTDHMPNLLLTLDNRGRFDIHDVRLRVTGYLLRERLQHQFKLENYLTASCR